MITTILPIIVFSFLLWLIVIDLFPQVEKKPEETIESLLKDIKKLLTK